MLAAWQPPCHGAQLVLRSIHTSALIVTTAVAAAAPALCVIAPACRLQPRSPSCLPSHQPPQAPNNAAATAAAWRLLLLLAGGYFDPAACLVPPGFGLIGDAAVPCPKGTWNNRTAPAAVGCRPCSPAGLTTRGNLTGATSSAACSWVLPGWGYSTALAPSRCPRGAARREYCVESCRVAYAHEYLVKCTQCECPTHHAPVS